jgi:hypothetical protein
MTDIKLIISEHLKIHSQLLNDTLKSNDGGKIYLFFKQITHLEIVLRDIALSENRGIRDNET